MNIRLLPLLLSLTLTPLSAFADEKPALAVPATDGGLPGAGPIRRMDWFTQLWLQRRTQWAERTERDQKAVVFLGDSITQGWGDDAGKSFGEMKV
ncbi:MAG: G-D-S-L family lipolytic protein, partial [Verrucomicrobiaceae bacterium]